MRVVTMRLTLALLLAALAVQGAEEPLYTMRYDGVDLERILGSRRLVTNYVDCLLGRKRCPPEGIELKKTLPDALKTGCTKCNEKQKTVAQHVIKHLSTKRTTDWERLTKKFDPEGEFKTRYEALLEEVTSEKA